MKPFSEEDKSSNEIDLLLVESILQGNREDLEKLILRYQQWIYNIALRMVWDPVDAEDITQDILIKIITKLSSFQGKSTFKIWLYKIVKNHVLTMKKRTYETMLSNFRQFRTVLEDLTDQDLPDKKSVPVEVPLLVEETKMGCIMGMITCLDREQRLIFIMGDIFGLSDTEGAPLFEISKDNFRQKLSRARKQLINFMDNNCGLINEKNSCRCEKKTKASIEAGYVDPHTLRFADHYFQKVKDVVSDKTRQWDGWMEQAYMKLFREQPFKPSPDFPLTLRKMLHSQEFQDIFSVSMADQSS